MNCREARDAHPLPLLKQVWLLRGARLVPTFPELDGQPPPGESHPKLRVHLMEIDHGPFCREVELPADVDRERIGAAHRNGLLWIELPKK